MEPILSFLTACFRPLTDPSAADWWDLEDREKLERLLPQIQALVREGEDGEVVESSKNRLAGELRRVALDAEDVLSEWDYEHLRLKAASSHLVIWIWMDGALSRQRLARQIEMIIERFEDFSRHALPLFPMRGDREMRHPGPSIRLMSSSLMENKRNVHGRDAEQEMLVNYLVSHGRSEFSVIALVGPALVGKTTLARLVYNDPRIADHFDCKSWVFVGEALDLRTTSLEILDDVTGMPRRDPEVKLDAIQMTLHRSLMGKRFLLVLDDLCDVSFWCQLEHTLRSASPGSAIVLTTVDEIVATRTLTARDPPPLYVERLSDEDCWRIFKDNLSDEEDVTAQGPDAIRTRVVERCGGMPLVAGLLAASYRREPRITARGMYAVERQIGNDTLQAVLHVYHRLPEHLKRCLSYCALFPKTFLFNRDRLVRLWIAQGLIQRTDHEWLEEDAGIECFKQLLSRSFFLQSEAEPRLYFMPGPICDLVYSISGDTHYMVIDGTRRPRPETLHLSLIREPMTLVSGSFNVDYSGLRSFLVVPLPLTSPYTSIMHLEIKDEMFLKLKHLRSLDLSYTDIEALPDTVGKLKHLRFLALNHTKIKRLPESMSKLYLLQTLELKQCPWLQELPRGIASLVSLRHLDVDSRHFLVHMPFQIQKLTNLQELPIFNLCKDKEFCGIGELQYLANLTDLGISGLCNVTDLKDARNANMQDKGYLKILKLIWPSNGSVNNYEELGTGTDYQNSFMSDGEAGEEGEQNVLHNVRNERVSIDEQHSDHDKMSSCDVDDMAQRLMGIPDEHHSNFSGIQLRQGIISLGTQDSVSCVAAVSEEDLLESLHPSSELEILNIKFYGGAKFPDWIGDSSFSELVQVEFVGCNCLVLPPLGRLQNLKFLRIDGMPVEVAGIEFCGTADTNAFPRLEILSFHNMNKWKKWDVVKEGDFPSLEKLSLFNCPVLKVVPNLFSSLEVLEVERCMELTNIPTSSLLQVLKLRCCDGLTMIPSLTSLNSLTIMCCQKLKSLPPLPQLDNIWIEDCEQLRSIVHCSCCPSSAELSCRISHESLLVAHCHQLCLPHAGPLVQSSSTGSCLVLSKFDKAP